MPHAVVIVTVVYQRLFNDGTMLAGLICNFVNDACRREASKVPSRQVQIIDFAVVSGIRATAPSRELL